MGRVSLDAAENDFCKALSKQELMKLVDEHLLNGDYETAVFWAEKIVAQSDAKNIREKLPELAHYMAVCLIFARLFKKYFYILGIDSRRSLANDYNIY